MKKQICASMAVACAAGSALVPVGRSTAQVVSEHACYAQLTLSFTPALTLVDQTGTLTSSNVDTCANASSTGAVGTSNSAGTSGTISYSGSCISATVSASGVSGLLLGGTVLFVTTPGLQVFVVVPADPCDDAGPAPATGVLVY